LFFLTKTSVTFGQPYLKIMWVSQRDFLWQRQVWWGSLAPKSMWEAVMMMCVLIL
jgi:hypothetical protein